MYVTAYHHFRYQNNTHRETLTDLTFLFQYILSCVECSLLKTFNTLQKYLMFVCYVRIHVAWSLRPYTCSLILFCAVLFCEWFYFKRSIFSWCHNIEPEDSFRWVSLLAWSSLFVHYIDLLTLHFVKKVSLANQNSCPCQICSLILLIYSIYRQINQAISPHTNALQ